LTPETNIQPRVVKGMESAYIEGMTDLTAAEMLERIKRGLAENLGNRADHAEA
jgi:hypothetical protein